MAGRSLKALLDAAVFRQEFWTGSIQDQSRNHRDVAYFGTPRWTREGAAIALRQSAINDLTQTGVVAPLVDFTASPFWVEFLWRVPRLPTSASPAPLYQASAGGWFVIWPSGTAYLRLGTYTAALGNARYVSTAAGSVPYGALLHCIGWLDATAGGLAGQWWINGAAVASVFTNTAPPVLGNPATINIFGNGGPGMSGVVARVFPGTPTADEVTTLYEASQRLVTPQSTIFRSFPERYARPGEPGVAAHYIFRPEELAQGRWLDRQGGGLDMTTVQQTPRVGPNGGIRGNREGAFGSWWRGTVVPVGITNFAYTLEHEQTTLCTGFVGIAINGVTKSFWTTNTGRVGCSFAGGVTSETPFSTVGRGIVRYDALYDGSDQILVANGRLVDQDAVVPSALGANLDIGQHGITTRYKPHNVRRTVAEARAEYVREFAREVIHLWKPVEEGETNATGLITNSKIGDIFVPSGSSSLKFVWLRDMNRLALQRSGVSTDRIAYPRPDRPMYGTYGIKFRILSNNTTEYMYFGVQKDRGENAIDTASIENYHIRYGWDGAKTVIGLYTGNTAVISYVTVNTPNNDTDHEIVFARCVSGIWYLYLDNQLIGSATNSTFNLKGGYFVLYPGSCQVYETVEYQSEMEPREIK